MIFIILSIFIKFHTRAGRQLNLKTGNIIKEVKKKEKEVNKSKKESIYAN